MKILIFSESFFPVVGGVESNSETLAQALQSLHHSVTLLTASQLNNYPELDASFTIVRGKSLSNLFKTVTQAELVIVNGDISVPVCLIAYLFRRPYMIIYQMAGAIVPKNKSLLQQVLQFVRLYLGKKAAMHTGVSNATLLSKNVIKKRQGVLYNPTSPDLYNLSKSAEIKGQLKKYDVLFAGRVIEGKGVYTLFDALKIIDKKGIKLTVLISGEGTDKNKLIERSASFLNVEVSFQNFVKGKELAMTYAQSRVMVLPSTSHKEGSPLSIAEAFTFSVPVIVSNQPAMMELVEGMSSLYFSTGDAYELSACIINLLNEDEHKYHSKYVEGQSKKFSYSLYVLHLKDILGKIV